VKPPDLNELQTLVRQAIEQYRTYRTVHTNRQHLQNWLRDFSQLEEPDKAPSTRVNDCLTLTFRNVLQSLTGMKQVIQTVARVASQLVAKQIFPASISEIRKRASSRSSSR